MTHTSAFCRAQEAFHRDRAAVANLDNVRIVATSAAAAWAREAVVALRREGKLGQEDQLPAAASLSEEEEDAAFSENPDRGLAT
ncbi:hypothetical protein AI27_11660 [Sphingomonas sp. BHC-A]|uniref:Uncharacterized protein n=1 Tax=Sphingobium indicum (strain DSM 16412 / CCM 7286 / MTCC 6364 / B90A) TaxID=861109 RepID=A0A1L5BKP1_SPHIB|nr:hypothetical protein [Sphingobium indicum]APL93475.1 hypothetical protein SIDU_02460 [Sphingobium indicum B90A]KEY98444.1 hypothetical protein AI27_11660 [Sphingomonas sp. BHC-A]